LRGGDASRAVNTPRFHRSRNGSRPRAHHRRGRVRRPGSEVTGRALRRARSGHVRAAPPSFSPHGYAPQGAADRRVTGSSGNACRRIGVSQWVMSEHAGADEVARLGRAPPEPMITYGPRGDRRVHVWRGVRAPRPRRRGSPAHSLCRTRVSLPLPTRARATMSQRLRLRRPPDGIKRKKEKGKKKARVRSRRDKRGSDGENCG
jgi:hypothetical protein